MAYKLAGRAAGATLGFIYNNTKGALIGARMAKYARTGIRARVARSNKRKATVYAGTKRRGSVLAAPPAKRRVFKSRPRKQLRGGKRRGGGSKRSSFANAIAKTGASNFSIGSGAKLYSGFKRTQLPTTFNCTVTQRVSGTSSTQSVVLLPTYGLRATGETGDTASQSQFTIDKSLLDTAERWLANNTNSSAAQTYSGPTGRRQGVRNTMKFVVNKLHYDQMIRNMSNQDADITLYDCVMRSGVDPNQAPQLSPIPNQADPLADWRNGLEVERIAAGAYLGATTINSVGTTPFHSSAFCKLYRVAKVTRKTLSSGEVHHHHVTVRPRNMFDTQVDKIGNIPDITQTNLNTRGTYIPGLTGFTILVASGSIGNNPDVATNNQIGMTAVALDVVTKTSASFSQFTRERRQHVNFDGMSTNNITAVVLDDTDAITTVQAAGGGV
ncbi:putative capsid protein [Trifolium-associated circular DNA virus 1]|uniref:Putative capsid protein n=1 Tax=Trifolium-associated circular DNA virus 1 TaxID=1590173 RepID=A0A0B4U7A3_9VIRU|nr:putative capsid protein [Trifolium-associated circular DNA virus 1]AJC52530.1 putative capsid protein [Trifolium-associated circular DNA virus 1]